MGGLGVRRTAPFFPSFRAREAANDEETPQEAGGGVSGVLNMTLPMAPLSRWKPRSLRSRREGHYSHTLTHTEGSPSRRHLFLRDVVKPHGSHLTLGCGLGTFRVAAVLHLEAPTSKDQGD